MGRVYPGQGINLQIRDYNKVRVLLGNLRIVSIITKKSTQDLCLSKGKQVFLVIKVTCYNCQG
jgi:ABC-type molybdate transport system ATPase subunit